MSNVSMKWIVKFMLRQKWVIQDMRSPSNKSLISCTKYAYLDWSMDLPLMRFTAFRLSYSINWHYTPLFSQCNNAFHTCREVRFKRIMHVTSRVDDEMWIWLCPCHHVEHSSASHSISRQEWTINIQSYLLDSGGIHTSFVQSYELLPRLPLSTTLGPYYINPLLLTTSLKHSMSSWTQ